MSAGHPSERGADLVTVGAGPQILRALADLETALAASDGGGLGERDGARMRVVAVDPFDAGSGAVWRVDQPAFLTMNVSAAVVDLRCPSVAWDLQEWHRRERGEPCPRYPARAVVGGYLRWAWRALSESPWLELAHRRDRVVDVRRAAAGWVCRIGGGAELASSQVLVGTGHREAVPFDYTSLASGDETSGPGARVVVRGAALTAYDAVLCLTAGRGGHWEPDPEDRLVPRYRPSGGEPRQIVLVSRSGRMMLPKPDEMPAALRAAVAGVATRWMQRPPLSPAWWDVLVEAACRGAASMGVRLDPGRARAWLDDPPAVAGTGALAQRWRADLARASGVVDEDPAWWLGRAWSCGYPDMLASIERLERHPDTWPGFRRRTATLERWAFGPPAELVARLLALIDHGMLTVCREDEAPPPSSTDVLAHIATPGVLTSPRPWPQSDGATSADTATVSAPWPGLLAAGHITVRPGETGVLTTPTGRCLGADGRETPGLSALGRPTEGPVIDHDSLQRRLHLDAQRWAADLARDWTDRAHVPTNRSWETTR